MFEDVPQAPLFELKHLEEVFRHNVIGMLLSKEKITEDLLGMLMTRRHLRFLKLAISISILYKFNRLVKAGYA